MYIYNITCTYITYTILFNTTHTYNMVYTGLASLLVGGALEFASFQASKQPGYRPGDYGRLLIHIHLYRYI